MSFVPCPSDSDFPIENLPYGVFTTSSNKTRRLGVAIGNYVLDLCEVSQLGLLTGILKEHGHVFQSSTLNQFMGMDHAFWAETRRQLQSLLSHANPTLQRDFNNKVLIAMSEVEMHLPADIGDYTDFYSSLHHATNVGSMFRDASNPLPPNWRHLPIAYHGRASSVVVSGTDIRRPRGQICPQSGAPPIFQPSKAMDFELEVAFFVGGPQNKLGQPISMDEAQDRIFGFVLMNDWSARDIQKWEYFPLGPFLSKNLGTSISPWVVTVDALRPYLIDSPQQQPQPLAYLSHTTSSPLCFDVNLRVRLNTGTTSTTITKSNLKHLYWSPTQQLVHHTTSGCPLKPGDLLGSGTISGPEADSRGCMLELTWNGAHPIQLANGSSRTFLQDNDEIIITGYAEKGNSRIGFGECKGKLLTVLPMPASAV